MNRNLIAFRKGLVTFNVTEQRGIMTITKTADLQNLLMSHGYILSEDAFNNLTQANLNVIENLIKDISNHFIETVGNADSRELEELFADGEEDVVTSFQSYLQLVWGGFDNLEIPQVYESVKFTQIEYVDETEFKKIFTNLVQIGTALTPVDFEIVEWFAKEYGDKNIMPNSIPFKENLCMVASLGMNVPVKTSTDVLRIATYMSNGTTDLILPPKMYRPNAWSSEKAINPKRALAMFKKFSRSERRYLLSLLEKVVDVKEMVLHRGRWIRLGEILHPGDYATRYPLTMKAFKELRNTKVKSWYSELDNAFLKSMKAGLKKLSERPGEFARRLDHLLRYYSQEQMLVLDTFKSIGSGISSKVLWELYSHFGTRTEEVSRSIWIKGARKPTTLPTLEPMDFDVVAIIQDTLIELITNRFASLDKLGNVFIDTELKKIPVPTNMRTLQDATKVVIRGTRMPLTVSKKVIRPYIHWTEGIDLDLSMSFIDYNGNVAKCDYTEVSPDKSVRHSGDVIPRVKGQWAEYIDINLKDNPYKYGLLTVHNFAGTSLEDVGAVIGFMERDNLKSSKKWSPDTIENSFKVSSQGSNVNLLIIDFETNEWILVDEDSSGIPISSRNDVVKYIDNLSKEPKLSVYDVLEMHVSVRGNKIEEITEDNEEDVDIKFTFDEFSTSYEKIASYML